MKRQTLVNGLLSLTVVSMMTACVDDKYDLSDIDTTSRFTVDNLTVPVKLSKIKLENVIDLDDNDLIETVEDEYVIHQGGTISPTEFKINGIDVSVPQIDGTSFKVNLPSIPALPGIFISNMPLGEINIDTSDLKFVDYEFKNESVDNLESLLNVKTSPIVVRVVLSLPSELVGGDNEISFKHLHLKLPQHLMDVTMNADVEVEKDYDPESGEVTIGIMVDRNGRAILEISASGLDLQNVDAIKKNQFGKNELEITGQVGVLGGALDITLKNFTLTTLPNPAVISVGYNVGNFSLKSFSGKIKYEMNGIHIDPISLDDLPDFLDSPETNIVIANPQILVSIENPIGKSQPEVSGKGKIILTSIFKDGTKVPHESGIFEVKGETSDFAFCTPKFEYDYVAFDGLRDVLSNGASGLPSKVEIDIEDISFTGSVNDFPIGTSLGNAEGSYDFNAPLGFGKGSKVIYETTQDGWGGDDLDDVNITKLHLKARCSTNLPVSVQLSVVPLDKNGKEIPVSENSGKFEVSPFGQNEQVALEISGVNGKPITDFDGVKFRAVVEQKNEENTSAIGPDLYIMLDDLRVTVDGYYETSF